MCEETIRKPRKPCKARSQIKWTIKDEDPVELYRDLGIIGEIPYDELTDGKMQSKSSKKCDDEANTASPKPDQNSKKPKPFQHQQYQRKRSREAQQVIFTPKKKFKMNIDSCNTLENICNVENDEINILPNEVLLKIFGYCSSVTKVMSSRVCKRWHDLAMDGSLWQQVSLAGKTIDIKRLKVLLENGTGALCLNGSTIKQPTQPIFDFSPYKSVLENDSVSSPRCFSMDPFSSTYHYSIHSLDLTNAVISSNTLCLIFMRCDQLRNVSLEGLDVTQSVLGCIVSPFLERLNLCLCHKLTSYGLVNLLNNCTHLTDLNLAWTNLCKESPREIIKALPSGLKRLNLSGFRNTLQDYDVGILTQQCPTLIEVDLSDCDSEMITSKTVLFLVRRLANSLQAVNLSRCYQINPNNFKYLLTLPHLRNLDLFGVLDDASITYLSNQTDRINICVRPFSAIARPSPSRLYGTRSRTIWNYFVK